MQKLFAWFEKINTAALKSRVTINDTQKSTITGNWIELTLYMREKIFPSRFLCIFLVLHMEIGLARKVEMYKSWDAVLIHKEGSNYWLPTWNGKWPAINHPRGVRKGIKVFIILKARFRKNEAKVWHESQKNESQNWHLSNGQGHEKWDRLLFFWTWPKESDKIHIFQVHKSASCIRSRPFWINSSPPLIINGGAPSTYFLRVHY